MLNFITTPEADKQLNKVTKNQMFNIGKRKWEQACDPYHESASEACGKGTKEG